MSKREAASARSVADLIAAVRGGAKPKYLFFWGHRESSPGLIGPACLSQWWPSPFVRDGVKFGSAEHYLMRRKAKLFDDSHRMALILTARSPAQAKAIGRLVEGYDEGIWAASRWRIVVDASIGKFSSDERLLGYLLGTGSRVLVEASPTDRIWGDWPASGFRVC